MYCTWASRYGAPLVARRHRRHPPSFWLMFVLRCRVGLLMQSASPSWIRTVAVERLRIICYCGHADAVDGGDGVKDCGVMTVPTHAAIVMR